MKQIQYVGQFSNDKFEGFGTLTCFLEMGRPNEIIKETYSGFFHNGKKHGVGTLHYTHRGTFKGKFHKGKMCTGYGQFTDLSGNVYVGDINGFEMSGQGTLNKVDGSKLIGQFCEGRLHGHGWLESVEGTKGPISEFVDGEFKRVLSVGAPNNLWDVL